MTAAPTAQSAAAQWEVSAWVDSALMTRQQRQIGQLRALCAAGPVARAVDLAFEHFATFGRDDHIIDLLTAATAPHTAGAALRLRVDELSTSVGAGPRTASAPCCGT